MDFKEYNDYVNKATNALAAFESEQQSDFSNNKQFSLDKLDVAIQMFSSEATDAETIKAALEQGSLKQKESLIYEGKSKAFERKYKEKFEEFSTNFNKFGEANIEAKKVLEKLRYDIVIEASVMRKAFVAANKKHPDEAIELDQIDAFLEGLKSVNFFEIKTADKNKLLKDFDKMIHAQQGFFRRVFANEENVEIADDVREDFGNREKADMDTFLEKALAYAVNSERLQLAILFGSDALLTVVANALQGLNTTLGMDAYKVDLVDKKTFADRKFNELLVRYQGLDGHDPNIEEDLASMEVPEEIDLINEIYLAGQWAYKNEAGKAIGDELKLEQEKTFKKTFLDKKYEVGFSLPIPMGPLAIFLTADISFGASFSAKLEIESKLKLHNFLSSKESKYVSGSFDGSLALAATVSAGLKITILHIASAEGKAVITGTTDVTLKANGDFNKGDESNIASFDATSEGQIILELNGKLVLVVGLTKVLNFIVKAVTGKDASKTYETDPFVFVRAERKAEMMLHLPVKSDKVAIPDKTFSFDGGRWIVTYPFQNDLKKQLNTKIFGDDNQKVKEAEAMLEGGKLTDDEKAALMQQYSPALTT
jgi:hypothetical protein